MTIQNHIFEIAGLPRNSRFPFGKDDEIIAGAIYVAPTGNDNNSGTASSPFRTLARAHTAVSAGGTIYMRGGTYSVTGMTRLTKSGTAGSPIRVYNYPGEKPALNGQNWRGVDGESIVRVEGNHYHVKGIRVEHSFFYGWVFWGSNLVIDRCEAYRGGWDATWGAAGFFINGGGNNLLVDCDSSWNRDNSRANADGFFTNSEQTGNILRRCRAWNNIDDGFDFFNVVGGSVQAPTLVEDCWSFNNGYGIDPSTGQPETSASTGSGFKMGGGELSSPSRPSGGHVFRRCISFDNLNWPFTDNGASIPLTLYNCVSYNAGSAFGIRCYGTCTHTIKNHIAYNTGGVSSCCNSSTSSHNSWLSSGNVTVNSSSFLSLDSTIAKGPRNADGSLPVSNFLRPNPNAASPNSLIDKGTYVGLPFNGSAPDLGAYEF